MNTTKSKYIGLLAVFLALLFATTPPLSAQTCTNPPAGLVGWWSGDGHFFDLVGARHGTPAGGTTFAAGKVAQGFNFDGNNQSVTIAYSPVLDVPPTGFTVEF